jgi:hypothetical protein
VFVALLWGAFASRCEGCVRWERGDYGGAALVGKKYSCIKVADHSLQSSGGCGRRSRTVPPRVTVRLIWDEGAPPKRRTRAGFPALTGAPASRRTLLTPWVWNSVDEGVKWHLGVSYNKDAGGHVGLVSMHGDQVAHGGISFGVYIPPHSFVIAIHYH